MESDFDEKSFFEFKRIPTKADALVFRVWQRTFLIKRILMKKVCVIGLGSVGLPTAVLAAKAGLRVVGIDSDVHCVEKINQCKPTVEGADLLENLQEVLENNSFKATTEYEVADYFVVAVPTPFKPDKRADLSKISSVASRLADVIKKGDTIILESTVPLGATLSFAQVIAHESGLKAGQDFFVAYCPERVIPGNVLQELKVNDRVIGGINQYSTQSAAEFYKYFVSGDLYLTGIATAEMVKLIENSYCDVAIAFANQVAAMAHQEGLNPYEVIELANKHPLVSIVHSTGGVGGHWREIDPWFLIESFPKYTELLKTARKINENRTQDVLAALQKTIASWRALYNRPCTIFLLGLTYKADTDDLCDSFAAALAELLVADTENKVIVCDPHVTIAHIPGTLKDSMVYLSEGLMDADVVVGLVAHSEFKLIKKEALEGKTVLDFCGLFYQSTPVALEQEQFFWPASESKHFYKTNHTRFLKPDSKIGIKEDR